MLSVTLWYQHIPATGFTHPDTLEGGLPCGSGRSPSRGHTVGPAVMSDDTNRLRPLSPDGQRRALLLAQEIKIWIGPEEIGSGVAPRESPADPVTVIPE